MPKVHRATLQPHLMSDSALWERLTTLIAACRWQRQATPMDRDRYLDEMGYCLMELRMRGTQLHLTEE